jgi:hypothetical protein
MKPSRPVHPATGAGTAYLFAADLYRSCIVRCSTMLRYNTGAPYRFCIGARYRVCIDSVSITYYDTVSWMYRVCIEMVSKNDNSIEVPTAPRTYRARIKCVSNKKCLDTVSRVVSRKSRYMYDTVRYTSIHFDTFMGKSHPDTSMGKRAPSPWTPCAPCTSS